MNANQVVLAGALLALLLTGCGAKPAEENAGQAATGTSAGAGTGQEQRQGGDRFGMNQGLIQMSLSFQTLIAMDKTEGLAITGEQAKKLLPIVQESITNNELSADNKTKLAAALTAEQQKYWEDSETQMQERMNQARQGGGPNGGGGFNGGAQNGGADGQAGQNGQGAQGGGRGFGGGADGQNGQNGQAPQDGATGRRGGFNGGAQNGGADGQAGQQNGQPSQGGRGGFGGGLNVGQQFVELLQSK